MSQAIAPISTDTFPSGFNALVVGSSGGIGTALASELRAMPACGAVAELARSSDGKFDICDEASIAASARQLANRCGTFHLIIDATGALEVDGHGPEKSLSALDPEMMARAFAVNTIGPALLFKHLTPLLPTKGKCVFATLSARVGSIGDNNLGGWYSYRASKAALNQIVKTAAIEIARKRSEAICLALHPGTVKSRLTHGFARGSYTHAPETAARRLLQVIDASNPEMTGRFIAYDGSEIPW